MRTITTIIKHELKSRVFTWITLVFILMLVFQGIWYTKGAFDYYVNEGVLMNAPAIFYRNFAGLGMLMVIIIAIVTGGVLYSDIQHKTAQWVYSMPINEKHFFLGRYLSAFLYLLLLGVGLFIGMLLVPYVGIGEPNRFGPAPIWHMLHAIIIFFIPNVLMYVSLIFASIIFFKRVAVGYLASLLLVVLFIVFQVSYEGTREGNLIYLLADPSGYISMEHYAETSTTFQKNTAFIPLTGYILINRLIWLSLAILLFVYGYMKFSFKYFITAGTSKSKQIKGKLVNVSPAIVNVPKVKLNYGTLEFITKLFKLAKLELLNIVRPTSFKIILFVMMLMILMQNLLFNANYYVGHEVPLTSNMTFFRLPWGVFIHMLLMIWAGELFFKEKTVNIWQITDALPIPVWVAQVSKLLASYALAFILCLAFIFIGIVSQIIEGGANLIDLKQYAKDVLGYRWGLLNFIYWISLVFFIAGLTGKRFLTYILTVGYFLIVIISFDMGLFEQKRFFFAGTVGVDDFSEISGYGILTYSLYWFAGLFGTLCLAFILLGILFWQRGTGNKWFKKPLGNQLYLFGKVAIILLLAGFVYLQYYLDGQIYSNGNFVSEATEEHDNAAYERQYAYLASKPQPKYNTIILDVEYYPKERRLGYEAKIGLKNTETDTLFLNFEDFVSVSSISLMGKEITPIYVDDSYNLFGYSIPEQHKKDSVLSINIKAFKQYVGLSQGELESDITANGSFAELKAFLPTIGYDHEKELEENRTREDLGLMKLKSRMNPINDPIGLSQSTYAPDALHGVTGQITIGTPANQLPLAPGKLLNSFEEKGRNYYTYAINNPQPLNWCFGSANYVVYKNKFEGVAYEIYADEKHPFNIEHYQDALNQGISHVQKVLKTQLPDEVRVYEIHKWAEASFYNFPNGFAISEKEGWYADLDNQTSIAYLYHTIGAQLAKLWVADVLDIANVQGADMLSKALPEAIGLDYLEWRLGQSHLDLMLKKKRDKYGKDRNNEANSEPALIYADRADYLEPSKGALAIYQLMQAIGKDAFYDMLQQWVAVNTGEAMRFIDLYEFMMASVSEASSPELRKQFETNEL